MFDQTCPCGTGETYSACCGRLHRGEPASSPEELMRARYSGYALGETNFVYRTWHPRTRPLKLDGEPEVTWTGLEIHDSGADFVEFVAHFRNPDGSTGRLHERSRFEQRRGRWVYLDGEASTGPSTAR